MMMMMKREIAIRLFPVLQLSKHLLLNIYLVTLILQFIATSDSFLTDYSKAKG